MRKNLQFLFFISAFTLLSTQLFAQDITVTIFEDVNGDGILDAGDITVAGEIPVLYLDGNGNNTAEAGEESLIAVVDNGDGTYTWPAAPSGTYMVEFPTPATAGANGAAMVPTLPFVNGGLPDDDDSDIDAATGPLGNLITGFFMHDGTGDYLTADAGFVAPVIIGDFVFLDENGNGINDGEPGVDAEVTLYEGDGVTLANNAFGTLTNPMTSAGGNYQFTDLRPGDYIVGFSGPAGPQHYLTISDQTGVGTPGTDDSDAVWTVGDATIGATDLFSVISGSVDEEERVDAGFYTAARIGDYVFEDLNGDGLQGNSQDLPGIEITLTRIDPLPFNDVNGNPYPNTTNSGGAGEYSFIDLPPGVYNVEFSSAATNPTFYLTKPDESGAGTPGTDDSDTADEAGGRQTGSVDAAGFDVFISAADPEGTETERVDAGFYIPVTLGDLVFHDLDANGNDDGDGGVAGINVTLFDDTGAALLIGADGGGLINPVVTPASGAYEFMLVPPGTYTMNFDDPSAMWYLVPEDLGGAGPAGATDSDAIPTGVPAHEGEVVDFVLMSGDPDNLDIDAGYYNPIEIGDNVFNDANANGQQDEPFAGPLNDFDVTLTRTDGGISELADGTVLPQTITAVGGVYEFMNVRPGEYEVTFVKPAVVPPYQFSMQDVTGGVDDTNDVGDDSDADDVTGVTHTIIIQSNDDVNGEPEDTRIDAGVFRCVSIGGDFWTDANGNGLQDGGPDEGPAAGVMVSLIDENTGVTALDCDGVAFADQAAGTYLFENVPPGEYRVLITALPGADWYVTLQHAAGGANDAGEVDNDNDFHPIDLFTHIIEVESEETDEETRIDGGIYQAASLEILAWHDSQNDGIYNNGDKCAEVTMDDILTFNLLLNGAAAFEIDGVTPVTFAYMGGGVYRAENLAPGVGYTVTTAAPAPWNFAVAHYDGTVADVGDGDDTDSDFDPGSGSSPTFELLAGPTKTNIDVGFYQNMILGGIVWVQFDDANGTFDGPPDEAPVADITMNLYLDADGDGVFETLLATVATDANGEYMFMDIPPGDYMVEVDRTNFDAGTQLEVFQCTSQNFGLDDTRNTNDGVGPMGTTNGGAEASPVLLRCGCEENGIQNKTVDFGFFFEFDCTENNPDYIALDCADTDPNSASYNDFFPICDVNILNAFCATMTPIITGNGPTPLCDNGGAPHNISWFSFVAGAGDYTIRVTPGNCTDAAGNPPGTGIQNGIYSDCTFSEQIGPCVGIPCSQAPTEVANFDPNTGELVLIPGNIYYWFLDGCSGTICEFEIDVIGDFQPFDPDCPTGIECEGDNIDVDCTAEVCPGEEILFTLQGFDIEQITYEWSVIPSTGWEVISTIPDPAEPLENIFNNIEIRFNEEGVYTVCWDRLAAKCYSKLRIGSCNNDPELCKTITVRSFPDEDFGIKYLCQWELDSYGGPTEDEAGNADPNGDGLLGWQTNLNFWSEGVYEYEVVRSDGCVYMERVEIIQKPDPDPAIVDTIFCGTDPVNIFGFTYDENAVIDQFNLAPDVVAANGCDSVIDLYIWFMHIEGELLGNCGDDGTGNPVFNLEFVENTSATRDADASTIYTYTWYRTALGVGDGWEQNDGDPDGNPNTFQATEAGEWQLHVNMTILSQNTFFPLPGCTFIFTVNVDPSTFLPPNPVPGPWNLTPCAVGNPPVEYTVEHTDDVTTRWIWPGDVASAMGDMTDTLTIDWTGSAGGDIGVYYLNDCGSSDTILMPVTLITVPDPLINIDLDTACIDAPFTVTSVGPVIGGESYTWNFSGGVVAGGTAVGPGPHEVSWSTEGVHEVTLQVNIGPCVSTIARDTVVTVLPIATPVITCGITTINSATFNWTPVAGATGYIVEVIQGPASNVGGPQSGTSFVMMDMAELEVGIIRVTAVTDNPCGNTVSVEQSCNAQDCPPVNITLTADPDTLCFDPSLIPIDINVDVDITDLMGTGTFSVVGGGPGIADASVGQFDPIAAGIGTHTVIYEFAGTGTVYENCAYNASMTFVIYQTPTSDFTIVGDDICIDETSTITYTGNTPNGLFDWTVNPDELVPALDGGGPFVGVSWPTAGSKSVTLVVERNGCVSTPTTLNVDVDPLIEQIDVECGESSATSVEFEWDPIANTTGYELSVDGGAPFTQTTTGFEVTGLTPGTVIKLVVTALSDNLCGNTVDSVECIAQNCPNFDLTVPEDFTLCSDEAPLDLTWSIDGGLMDGSGAHEWTGNGITDSILGTFDPSISGIGIHQITLTYWEGPDSVCTDDTRFIIEVIDLPIVAYNLSSDTICLSETIDVAYVGTPPSLDPMMTVNGGNFVETTPRNYEWTFTNPGTYEITGQAFVGNCIAEPVVKTVVVLEEPMETVVVNCFETDLDRVSFIWNDIDCASEYEIFINGVSVGIQPETELTYEITGLNEGDTRTIRVVPIDECDCATLMEGTETCEATACPDLQAVINNPLPQFCIDDAPTTTVQLTAIVSGNLETGETSWMGTGVDENGMFDPTGLAAGEYEIMYSYSENNGSCSIQDMTTITINANPTPFANAEQPPCYTDNFGSIGIGSSIEGVSYDATINGDPVSSNFIEMLAPGIYNFEFTDPANGCITEINNVELVSAPEVVAELVGDSVILKGLSTTLRVEFRPVPNNIERIEWDNRTSGEAIPCPDLECEFITVSPSEATQYCATLYYDNGCVVSTCLTVRVNEDPDITIPNIINPTETSNPVFYVPHNGNFVDGQGFHSMKKMIVYNRWGELVYKVENVPGEEQALKAAGWDGRFNGNTVNPGVYVYVIEIIDRDPDTGEAKAEADIYTGDVTVLK